MGGKVAIMVEEIMMFFESPKINVSGIADVPLTSRLRSADFDADSDADVVLSGSPASPLFFTSGYVSIPMIKKAF
ncbi:hypothetical protein BECAL_03440 [Bellilinea caldifistulae]|jgi:hypothetical protein|uniref:VCBS repeat-containing protein n=2 Tax=Bellilinea caldifistulae TaxID=360411 RepID=A0A0N8GMZ3_9CHLR|nr:hypothetical protein AC812_04885 [Bellilinea caldifistulae]GAP12236.1 hypothetical protein BECAL_03440 [Bellilinea caldifistulae]